MLRHGFQKPHNDLRQFAFKELSHLLDGHTGTARLTGAAELTPLRRHLPELLQRDHIRRHKCFFASGCGRTVQGAREGLRVALIAGHAVTSPTTDC